MAQQIIGFIGAGNMAASLVGGMIARGIRPARIWMSDISPQRLEDLHQLHHVHTSADNEGVVQRSDVLVLAVKPQVMPKVCEEIRGLLGGQRPLIISIAAGVTVTQLREWLGELPVIRTMPNTPAMVQAGVTGLFAGPDVDEGQRALAGQILGSVGLTFWFDTESALDSVTAVSGSGPAYYFLLMEAMIDVARALGLDDTISRQMVLQTALGAAQLAIASESEPAQLRQQVTSPGGTTAAALDVFEKGNFRTLVSDAVKAAQARATQLAEGADSR